MAIRIAHEAPKAIFREIQKRTDYDYALVHLFEEDPEYLQMFKDAVAKGREVILDNSIFELGTAFDPEKFLYWINELKPTWYIVPDALEDADQTITNMSEWLGLYKNRVTSGSKMIGVVQGKDYEDIRRCYQFMARGAKVDKIAISFDYSYYEKTVPHPNKLVSWMLGRVKLLGDLRRDGVLREDVPHHLLGCALPGEGIFYSDGGFPWIESMDTSNPVVHGLKKIWYKGSLGLTTKASEKLYTLINSEVNLEQWSAMLHNITDFRVFWNG